MTMLSVADVSVYENLAVVRLSMLHEKLGGGTAEFIGSGVVIAPGFVLTASHNLYIDAARVA